MGDDRHGQWVLKDLSFGCRKRKILVSCICKNLVVKWIPRRWRRMECYQRYKWKIHIERSVR